VAQTVATAHVWWARRQDASPHLEALLDDTERGRHDAYRREEDRQRFLVGCALAKTVIAAQLNRFPREVTLDRACTECAKPHGKPRVTGTDLELSISHSGDRIAVATATVTAVGVDVEQLAGRARHPGGDDPDALVRYVLSDSEQEALAEQQAERHHDFLVAWTRKEAVTKATGDGLRVSFKHVVVSPASQPPRVISWPYIEPVAHVTLFDLTADEGYVAALAVIGRCDEVVPGDGSALLKLPLTRAHRPVRHLPDRHDVPRDRPGGGHGPGASRSPGRFSPRSGVLRPDAFQYRLP
jgi:4'-phosphopantetheinyl transferase